jgi:hypothetical protein
MVQSAVFDAIQRFLPLLAFAFIAACSPSEPGPIILGAGWYNLEISTDGNNWWVWTKEHGQIVVKSRNDATLTLRGGVGSIQRPNKVDVSVNGKKVAEWDITGDKYEQKPFKPLPVALVAGNNNIVFKSHNKAIKIPIDVRELAIAVDNLTLTNSDGRIEYALKR